MPLKSIIPDALGVVTISLVAVLVLVGLFCVIYSLYFHSRIRGQGLVRLNYFSGPWVIRITCIFFVVWWGVGEIIRLNVLRHNRRFLGSLTLKWQEIVCECYIVSNLGFAEPCLFLTFVFLLRASLQKSGTLSRRWNLKTAGFVILCCFPVFIVQLIVILIGPWYKHRHNPNLPSYFINATRIPNNDNVTLYCAYPLLSTIFLGLFAIVLTTYLFWLGRQILHLVINKGLQKRVYTLVFSISSFFLLRVLLLGLSVLPREQHYKDAIAFLSFLSLLCCAGVGICLLVYLPIADSLSLGRLPRNVEARRTCDDDMISLIANQSPFEGSLVSSPGTGLAASEKRGSVSFRVMGSDEDSGADFVELSLFNPSRHSSPPGSPRSFGWPMVRPLQGQGL